MPERKAQSFSEAEREVARIVVAALTLPVGGCICPARDKDMSRLSVDIDVVYVAHATPRAAALKAIAAELNAIRDRLKQRGLAAEVTASAVGD